MKSLLFILSLVIGTSLNAQKTSYKEYSYTEFFQLIEAEKDSVFMLSDAIITYNESTDSLFRTTNLEPVRNRKVKIYRKKPVTVDKEIQLSNVHFLVRGEGNDQNGVISGIIFKRPVELENTLAVTFSHCEFHGRLNIPSNNELSNIYKEIDTLMGRPRISIHHSKLFSGASIRSFDNDLDNMAYNITNNEIYPNKESSFRSDDFRFWTGGHIFLLLFTDNVLFDSAYVSLHPGFPDMIYIFKNTFTGHLEIFLRDVSDNVAVEIDSNRIQENFFLSTKSIKPFWILPYHQFKSKLIWFNIWSEYDYKFNGWDSRIAISRENVYSDSIMNHYQHKYLVKDGKAHSQSNAFMAMLYNHYKTRFDYESSNVLYKEIKDLQTQRMEYLYRQDPSFRKFFKWKVNQFLKVFSEYGTEPSKAIVVSFYVIIFFAFIYLFSPNSWDSHGKKRIMDRFRFFTKYMKRDAGIHEVYLEEKKEDLLDYEDFKNYMEASGKSIPKFFLVTALPLYKWAISGTKLTSAFLKRVDVMKGTWEDVPDGKRWWKGILLIGAFSIAIIYDIMIKMLNALMLSINTFTTLGFGEIPIKGLPRYLAIIEGFIGWFMLTIFSVSLISQLLN
jgi:hypothetical protein